MKKYFFFGFHLNNAIYAFLAINLIKFIINLTLSLKRFKKLRRKKIEALKKLEKMEI
jgi:hypothetical protein